MHPGVARTVCMKCRHLKLENLRAAAWSGYRCLAVTRDRKQDPVTGDWGWAQKNDLGLETVTEERHPACRDVNKDGECHLYEEAKG